MDTPPPPADAEAQAEQTHSAAEDALLIFLAVSVLTEDDDSDLHLLSGVAFNLATGILRASFGSKGDGLLPDPTAIADSVAADTLDLAREYRQSVQDTESPMDRRQASASLATVLYGKVAEALSKALQKPGVLANRLRLKKTWLTKRDARVRPLHRLLHGKTKYVGKDFWRWPITGQRLSWPGDPRAPLDATIGCRCHCILSWSPQEIIDSVVKPLPEEPT